MVKDTKNVEEDQFHLCMTCGHLKHGRLFEKGDCTCQDCYDEVARDYRQDASPRYKESPEGDGFIYLERSQ